MLRTDPLGKTMSFHHRTCDHCHNIITGWWSYIRGHDYPGYMVCEVCWNTVCLAHSLAKIQMYPRHFRHYYEKVKGHIKGESP